MSEVRGNRNRHRPAGGTSSPGNRQPAHQRPRIIAILQPVYLPWLGYFEQMALADHFVFLDDVQYTRHDWRNRNRIKCASGPMWLTVPVMKHQRSALINEILINDAQNWRRKQLRSIEFNYEKCGYFRPFFDELKHLLLQPVRHLFELDIRLISLLGRYLEIATPTSASSAVEKGPGSSGDKNQRIIELCRYHRAEILYDGASAAAFIDTDRFRKAGIDVVFQAYEHPVYEQPHGDFVSHLSAIDLIMSKGPKAPQILRSSPSPDLHGSTAGRKPEAD